MIDLLLHQLVIFDNFYMKEKVKTKIITRNSYPFATNIHSC